MDFRANAREIYITHAELAFLAEETHPPEILGDDRERQTIIHIVVNARGILIVLEWNERHVRAEDFFAHGTYARLVLLAINERRKEPALFLAIAGDSTSFHQNRCFFLFGQIVVTEYFFHRCFVDDWSAKTLLIKRMTDVQ